MKIHTVDIALPVYSGNRDILEESVRRLHRELGPWRGSCSFQIVVSINGPAQQEIRETACRVAASLPGVRVLSTPRSGKGWGVFHAWTRSAADAVCYMDVDLAADVKTLPVLLDRLRSGADIAVGSRYCRGARLQRTFRRLLLSRIYHVLLINGLLRVPLRDVQCGFKACRTDVARKIIPRVKDRKWFFEAEMLFLAHRSGFRIEEVPVTWREAAKSSLHVLRASVEFLWGVIRLRFASRHRGPNRA